MSLGTDSAVLNHQTLRETRIQTPSSSEPVELGSSGGRLVRGDYILLAAFALVLFGFSWGEWRPMTMHEGVLPQTARTMFADRDWVVPKNGGRPWLESPPLPQWVTVATASLVGRCDELWIVRIPPALVGMGCVLMVAWMASVFYGRTLGLLAGAIHATMYEIAQYAWLSEDEIFLCGLVTASVVLFVGIEFAWKQSSAAGSRSFFGVRPLSLVLLFTLLGLTNLAKGLLFGTVMSLVPIALFLLWNNDWRRTLCYFWLPGWLLFVAIAAAWPVAAYLRYPDVVDVWLFDHKGRLDGVYADITQPWYYYAKLLPTIIAPWSLVAPLGLALTARAMWTQKFSPERFLWCWAIGVPVVFSIPTGKHHHYLLHAVAPWSILSAVAVRWLYLQIQTGPAWLRNPWPALATVGGPIVAALWLTQRKTGLPTETLAVLSVVVPVLSVLVVKGLTLPQPRLAAATLFGVVGCGFLGGHVLAGIAFDQSRYDAIFLSKVRETIAPEQQLLINAATRSLDEFRFQFSQTDRAKVLHNLTFLRDASLTASEVYVITRARDLKELSQYGEATLVLQSEKTRREKSPTDRWSLFKVTLKPDLERVAAEGVRVSPMQAMQRAEGPYLEVIRR